MSARKIAIDLVKRFPILRRFVRKVLTARRKIAYYWLKRSVPTEAKTIIFEVFMGRNYADSPRAIYEQMLSEDRFSDYRFIWAFKKAKLTEQDMAKTFPNLKRAEIVTYGSQAYDAAHARAGIWISNSRLPEHISPKTDQKYIQTWHGTSLKRLGHDIQHDGKNAMNSKRELHDKYDADAAHYFAMVSPSRFMTNVYRSAFNLAKHNKDDIVWEIGYPRNDRLVNATDTDIAELKKQLDIPSDKKVILYAPTWRDDQHQSDQGYTYNNELDFDELRRRLGEEYIVLFRAHYFIANSFDFAKYNGFVRDVSKIDDVNDLYLVSDMLITDYSSVFFDYAILNRPIAFYMYDLDKYRDEIRGFYMSLDELPGPVTTEINGLVRAVQDASVIENSRAAFLEKYAPMDDGKVSQRVVDKIARRAAS